MKELQVIRRFFSNSLQQQLTNIPIFLMFSFSKLVRYGLFMSFLYFLITGTSALGGYTREQIMFFYLTFNLLDTLNQLLFREVYRFRPLAVSGGFDMVLAKPMNPLIRCLLGGPDFIDAGIILILVAFMFYFTSSHFSIDIVSLLTYILLIVNTVVIAAAFHIVVLAVGILTLSVDHLIMVYRDLTSLVRIPADFYAQPLRSIITFIIPLGVMFTVPARALLGLLSWPMVLVSLFTGVISIQLAIKFWHYAVKQYSSASS